MILALLALQLTFEFDFICCKNVNLLHTYKVNIHVYIESGQIKYI